MNKKAIHFWNELEDGNITNWKLISITKGNTFCACGTPIKNIYSLEHNQNKKQKIIGKYCAEKLGLKLSWKTKADYLANAYLMARNEKEKIFIRQQQDRLPKWDNRIIMSIAQKKWLENITNKTWKGKIWGETK